jgi:alpha-glucoside transport system ATP-binding protein
VIGKLPGIHREMRGKTVALTAPANKVHLFADGVSLLYS